MPVDPVPRGMQEDQCEGWHDFKFREGGGQGVGQTEPDLGRIPQQKRQVRRQLLPHAYGMGDEVQQPVVGPGDTAGSAGIHALYSRQAMAVAETGR